MKDIVAAKALSDYRLYLRFEDGVQDVVDLAPPLSLLGVFEPMRLPRYHLAQSNYSQYVPVAADRSLPYASPILASDHRRLPPARIITAGFDPLRDSEEAYAQKLANAGVPTHLSRYEGVVHGFLSAPFVRKADKAIDESTAALREAFGRNLP